MTNEAFCRKESKKSNEALRSTMLIEVDRWLKQAEYDLGTAQLLLENKRWPTVCFHAQQAAAKAVKAYLYLTGEKIVLGHSVVKLIEEASLKNSAFNKLTESGRILDRFYIPTRYPNGLPGGIAADVSTENDANSAIFGANKIIETVKEMLEE